ncbi:hypothetical protein ACE01N_15665 [Saccharicrinis sp. FJH2]|uniref:hypothetical protein n=1 Tax=Saccharicrinis sp. FJH65 TaxID=3344659 RepID=UPI0035F385A0
MNDIFRHTIDVSNKRNEQSLSEIENYQNKHVVNKNVEFTKIGDDVSFSIIFSTSKGVYILDTKQNICKQILAGKFYGITKYNDFTFFARLGTKGERSFPINNRVSEICYSKICDYRIENLQIALYGIPSELHQIEIINDNLVFPHTGYNQILSIPLEKIFQTNKPLKIDSCHSIELELNEYSHLNSIFYLNERFYIIAHNYTMKTNRLSDLIVFNTITNKQETIHLNAHSAHNIFIKNGDMIYCDSNNKILMKNEKVLFTANKLLRGLSVTEKNSFVGGSDICFDNYERYSSNPSIYVLNNHGKLQSEYIFEELGDIYEIRQLYDKELSVIQN